MAAPDQILTRVTTMLVQALGVDEDDVTPAASLFGDLGAESIDLLDIVFRLEREFAITIPRGELFIELNSPGEADYLRGDKCAVRSSPAPLQPIQAARLLKRMATSSSRVVVRERLGAEHSVQDREPHELGEDHGGPDGGIVSPDVLGEKPELGAVEVPPEQLDRAGSAAECNRSNNGVTIPSGAPSPAYTTTRARWSARSARPPRSRLPMSRARLITSAKSASLEPK